VSPKPFLFEDVLADKAPHFYEIAVVDSAERTAKTEGMGLSAI
jgi:hypothetical protein